MQYGAPGQNCDGPGGVRGEMKVKDWWRGIGAVAVGRGLEAEG